MIGRKLRKLGYDLQNINKVYFLNLKSRKFYISINIYSLHNTNIYSYVSILALAQAFLDDLDFVHIYNICQGKLAPRPKYFIPKILFSNE